MKIIDYDGAEPIAAPGLYRMTAAQYRADPCETPSLSSSVAKILLEMARSWQRPRFPLTGRDVMAAGVAEGPDVGRILAQVEDWWIGGDFSADEGACRERLAAVIAGT